MQANTRISGVAQLRELLLDRGLLSVARLLRSRGQLTEQAFRGSLQYCDLSHENLDYLRATPWDVLGPAVSEATRLTPLHVPASNWTGSVTTVLVDRETLTWEQFGYQFWLERRDWESDASAARELLGPYYYVLRGADWENPLCDLFFDPRSGTWTALAEAVQRESADPVAAAVQLIANIV